MRPTFNAVIERYNPDTCRRSEQHYEVKFTTGQTVLQTLNFIRDNLDDSLSFRSSCQGGKCGSCAITLNGKPVLACCSVVGGGDITIGPLGNFPVINDLIVSRNPAEDYFSRMLAQTSSCEQGCHNHVHRKPDVCIAEKKVDYLNLSRCIGCLICTSSCPLSAGSGQESPNPSMLITVFSSGVLTLDNGQPAFPIGKTIGNCTLCSNCFTVCPAGVQLKSAITQSHNIYKKSQKQKQSGPGSDSTRSPNLKSERE
jgi:succinate dehydrogenase/fumarate reductase iron-sulfur protein